MILLRRFGFLFLLVLLAGCQKAPVEGVVFGKVTLNGEPATPGGLIRMVAVAGDSQPNDCPIGPEGKYEIKIAPGEKKVELTWRKGEGAVPDTANQGTLPPPKQMFPAKYNSATELRYTVTPGRVEHNFEIKDP